MRTRYAAVLMVAACGQGAGEARIEPSPWSYEPAGDRAPTLSEAEIAAEVERWLPQMLTLDLAPVFEAYDMVNAAGDGACPMATALEYEGASYATWSADCQAETGALFQGYTELGAERGVDEAGWTVGSRYIYGVADAALPDAWSFSINGYIAESDGWHEVSDGVNTITELYKGKDIQATVDWGGPAVGESWLTGEVVYSGGASFYEQLGSGRYIAINGSVSGIQGEVTAIAVSNLEMLSTGWTMCPVNEPHGTVSVRAADGGWYDVVFDAPVAFDETTDLSGCDGCGALWFEGRAVGKVCVDLLALVDGEASPW